MRSVASRPIGGSFPGTSTPLTAWSLTPDGLHAVSGSTEGTVRVWEWNPASANWTCAAVLEGHRGPVRGVVLTADGQCSVSGSN